MTLAELVRKYQRYDPATGGFDRVRTQREYAAELRLHPVDLSRFLTGARPSGAKVLRAFLRTYPEAAVAVTRAIAEEERAKEADHAVA